MDLNMAEHQTGDFGGVYTFRCLIKKNDKMTVIYTHLTVTNPKKVKVRKVI